MSEIIQKAQTFEDRIGERIRDSIGELMTDDDLRAIVQRGIEKALFEKRITDTDRYGHHSFKAPIVDELVDKYLKQEMTEAVGAWIKANPDKLQEAIERTMRDGVASAVLSSLDARFGWIFKSAIDTMRSQGLLQP